MAATNYNSYPQPPELIVYENGTIDCLRERQTLDQITQNETQVLM